MPEKTDFLEITKYNKQIEGWYLYKLMCNCVQSLKNTSLEMFENSNHFL